VTQTQLLLIFLASLLAMFAAAAWPGRGNKTP